MRQVSVGLFAALVILLVPFTAQAQLAVYEDWSGTAIRGDRWHGGEDNILFALGGLETTRSLESGRPLLRGAGTQLATGTDRALTMRLRIQSSSLLDDRSGFNMMHVTHVAETGTPGSVDALEATYRITSVKMTPSHIGSVPGCTPGDHTTDPSGVDAGITMTKFNDGSSSGTGDRTGDIIAIVGARSNTDFLHFDLNGFLARCGDPACITASIVTGSKHTFPGTPTRVTPFRLGIVDNPGGNEFQVTFNGTVVGAFDYTGLPASDAGVYDAALYLRVNTGDCWVGSPTPNMFADITVKVGEVRTNAGAVIP